LTTPSLGFALATTGGFVTTNHQQVLDENYEPIPGLYASGNTCGMRFGSAYITPMAGVSIGTALTLGRELGKYLAEQS
jgi:predicted oxidoreductase